MIGKPAQQDMVSGDIVEEMFGRTGGLLAQMGSRSWLEECCTCEAVSEFRLGELQRKHLVGHKLTAEGAKQSLDLMFAAQHSGLCARTCWREGRGLDVALSAGRTGDGEPILRYVKAPSCPVYCPVAIGDGGLGLPCCCCLLPEVRTVTADGVDLGSSSRYVAGCTPCVPKVLYSEQGEPVYLLKPETCCCGCCVACSCRTAEQSYGNFVPFYFHDPATGVLHSGPYGGEDAPHIQKVLTRRKESCFSAESFAILFPQGIDAKRKAGLLGLAFLLQFIAFERQAQNST